MMLSDNKRIKKLAEKPTTNYNKNRKVKKRDFRQLWIARISAAVREEGMTYSRFINGLNKAGVEINRKVLSNLAIEDPKSFSAIVATAKAALGE